MATIAPEIVAQTAQQVHQMVIETLEQLTRWAFPHSQASAVDGAKWQLWHTTQSGERIVDLEVSFLDNGKKIVGWSCTGPSAIVGSKDVMTMTLTYEALNEAVIRCACKS